MCVCSNAKEGGADPTAASSKTEEGGEYSRQARGRLEGRPRRSLAPLTLLEGGLGRTDERPTPLPPRPLSPVAFPPPHQEDFLTIPPPHQPRAFGHAEGAPRCRQRPCMYFSGTILPSPSHCPGIENNAWGFGFCPPPPPSPQVCVRTTRVHADWRC